MITAGSEFDPNCMTCVWLKQHRDGRGSKAHFCGAAFHQSIHDAQIAAEGADEAMFTTKNAG